MAIPNNTTMAIPNNTAMETPDDNTPPIAKKKRTSKGRRKIEIKKIDKTSSRQVTFSKRRGGLFRKASELCILTGAEIAVIVHSQGNRVFTFGHSSVDSVVNRFLHGGPADVGDNRPTRDHNRQYSNSCKELEAEKQAEKKRAEAEKVRSQAENKWTEAGSSGGDGGLWCNAPVEDMGLEESELYLAALDELIRNAIAKADDLRNARTVAAGGEGFLSLMGCDKKNEDCAFPCDLGQTTMQ